MASSSTHVPDHQPSEPPIPFSKPPSPDPPSSDQRFIAELQDVALPVEPPPPYPSGSRAGRRMRENTARSMRRAIQASDDTHSSPLPSDGGGETETSPLLGGRRRTNSHSSTIHSVQSLAHTVISSSRTVISLFQSDAESAFASLESPQEASWSSRARRYFRPLTRKAYYAALVHLLFINFPYELVAWIYLFVGTLTGTTLLITLPIGIILCFFDLLGARILARGEIALQTRFHGPLAISPPDPPHPIFSRMRTPTPSENEPNVESGRHTPVTVPETSFLRLAFLMFQDPTSYQALFYFLVIKPGITLLITLALLALVPIASILVFPAPAVLRAVRRVGIWQAELAIDALS